MHAWAELTGYVDDQTSTSRRFEFCHTPCSQNGPITTHMFQKCSEEVGFVVVPQLEATRWTTVANACTDRPLLERSLALV